jgi:hypothetical protein
MADRDEARADNEALREALKPFVSPEKIMHNGDESASVHGCYCTQCLQVRHGYESKAVAVLARQTSEEVYSNQRTTGKAPCEKCAHADKTTGIMCRPCFDCVGRTGFPAYKARALLRAGRDNRDLTADNREGEETDVEWVRCPVCGETYDRVELMPAPKSERMKDLDSTQLAVIDEMLREQLASKPEGRSCEGCVHYAGELSKIKCRSLNRCIAYDAYKPAASGEGESK